MEIAERLKALAELTPVLESADADFGHWEAPAAVDGVQQVPYFELGPTAAAFTSAVGRGVWVVTGFDWMTWLQTSDGQALRDRPEALAAASADDLARLLTAIVRSDRFVEGSLAGAFESGLLARIARRAAALLADEGSHLTYDLDRFVVAQKHVYAEALDELRRGRKSGHWIWYVFPQIAGLGYSDLSQQFAIRSLDEARAYLTHPLLGARLRECAAAILATTQVTAEEILGATDAMKVRSCMTLFHRAAPDEPVFVEVLDRFYGAVPDAATDARLGRRP